MFFFQAEDGIRDIGVTGVQTCALPISSVPGTNSSAPSTSAPTSTQSTPAGPAQIERKSVAEGKRADPGGRRIIKKKTTDATQGTAVNASKSVSLGGCHSAGTLYVIYYG